jgi:hypothetical protein
MTEEDDEEPQPGQSMAEQTHGVLHVLHVRGEIQRDIHIAL